MTLAVFPRLPRRDEEARGHLERVAEQARPVVLAREQTLALPARLAELIPDGVVVRGTVVQVSGEPGAGSTTVAFELAAAVTSVGEWAAAVDLDGTLGALAANEAGVALERFAVVRRVPPARWTTVVAALLDGVSLVIAEVPRGVGLGDARRLIARARERRSVLVAYETRTARWPAEAALRLSADGSAWEGLVGDMSFLMDRRLHLEIEGRGVAARARRRELARVG